MRRILRGFAVPAAGLHLALAVVVAGALPVSAQVEAEAPPPDTGPLARFVPRDNLALLIEFDGIEQHLDAWTNTAAYKVLNDTSTGAMLADLIAQAAHISTVNNPERRVGGDEALAVLKHILQFGAVIGVTGPIDGFDGDNHGVIVIREAATKEARPLFGKLVAEAMGRDVRPEAVDRGSRRVVEYTPVGTETRRAWWAEGGHLFLTEAKDVDVIHAVLDGNVPNATNHPLRNELSSGDGDFQPVGWMFVDVEKSPPAQVPPEMSETIRQLGLDGLKRLDYRWGFEGEATMSMARLVAPEPRAGALALFDQPTFTTGGLPPMPTDVDSFTVLSLDPLPAYDQIAKLVPPEVRGQLEEFERQVKSEAHRDLREQILATIGPRAAVYFPPSTQSSRSALNPLALAANLSVQVPRATLLVELKNRGEFIRSLDELMIQANRLLEEQTTTLAAMLGAAPPPAPPAGGREAEAPRPARFRLLSSEPKLYVLQLPPQLGSLINLNLTVAVGKEHLIVATSTDLARQALALEESTEGRWTPTGALATSFDRLPESLMLLRVSDPSDTLPEALASLPTTLQAVSDSIAAAQAAAEKAREDALAAGPGGGPQGAAPGFQGASQGAPGRGEVQSSRSGRGGPGEGRGLEAGAGPGGPPGQQQQQSGGGYGSSSAMMAGGQGGQQGPPGAGPGQQQPPGAGAAPTLRLDPSKAPSAADVRPLLFPGSMAVSVDAEGVRIVTRSAFPNLVSSSGGIAAALLLPAIQSAREAARRASESSGSSGPNTPAPGKELTGWGRVYDPVGDVQFLIRDGGLVTRVPAGPRDLNPGLGGSDAPRVLSDVNGDFTATVLVAGSLQPGDKSAVAAGYPYNGAGLLLWQDGRSYVRLERAAIRREGQLVSYVNYEVYRNGQRVDGANAEIANQATHLRLERRGGQILAAISKDGVRWNDLKPIQVELAPAVQVGVAAVNTAEAPFEARFENLQFEGETGSNLRNP